MQRNLSNLAGILAVVLCSFLAACGAGGGSGSSGSGGTGGSGQQFPNIQGQWTLVGMGAGTQSDFAGVVVEANISQTESQFSSTALVCPIVGPTSPFNAGVATAVASEMYFISLPQQDVCVFSPLSGSFDSPSTFNATLTGFAPTSLLGYSPNATFEGTVTGGQMSGSFTGSDGDTGNWTGTQFQSLSGTYGGTLSGTPPPSAFSAITLAVTQGPAPNYVTTATAAFTNSPCYRTLSLTGNVYGGSMFLHDSSNAVFFAGVETSASSPMQLAYFINSGCGADTSGDGALNQQ